MKTFLAAAIVVVVIAVVGVGAFFAGTSYGEAQAQNTRSEFFRNRQGGNGGQGNAFQGGQGGQNGQTGQNNPFGRAAAFGTVKSVSGNTIQLTQQDGSTVSVTVNAQTTIQKTVNGGVGDIQPGERLTVFSDQTGGSITARAIQVRPTGQ